MNESTEYDLVFFFLVKPGLSSTFTDLESLLPGSVLFSEICVCARNFERARKDHTAISKVRNNYVTITSGPQKVIASLHSGLVFLRGLCRTRRTADFYPSLFFLRCSRAQPSLKAKKRADLHFVAQKLRDPRSAKSPRVAIGRLISISRRSPFNNF